MAITAGLARREEELEHLVADGSRDPAERVRALTTIRDALIADLRGETDPEVMDDFTALIGRADSYIGALELAREGAALSRVMELAARVEDAEIRSELRDQRAREADQE